LKERLIKYFLVAIALASGIYWLSTLKSNNQPVYKDQKPQLDTSLPIYTQQVGDNHGAMVCPMELLANKNLSQSPKRLFEIATSFTNRSEKIKEVGCQEWKGGLEVHISDPDLARINQLQAENKVGFIFFQHRPLNQGLDLLMVYSGDLTNNPSGKYGDPFTPPLRQSSESKSDYSKFSIENQELIKKWLDGVRQNPENYWDADIRKKLNSAGICFGMEGQSRAQYDWHQCTSKSFKDY
jgi:hypothetical protein